MDNLRNLQLSEYKILCWFADFCEKNNLKYYIVAGTLLGAVRHGGFIPWDDDVDVAMPREDFIRFEKLITTDCPKELFYQSCDTEKLYAFGFSKLRLNGTRVVEDYLRNVDIHQGIYIDIFPLDKCPRGFGGKLMFKLVELTSSAMMECSGMDFACGYTKPYMRWLYKRVLKLGLIKQRKLRDKLIAFFTKGADGSLLCTVHGAHGFPRETYETKWLGEGKAVKFEDRYFNAPVCPELALANMYGDYTKPPEDKAGHFVRENNSITV